MYPFEQILVLCLMDPSTSSFTLNTVMVFITFLPSSLGTSLLTNFQLPLFMKFRISFFTDGTQFFAHGSCNASLTLLGTLSLAEVFMIHLSNTKCTSTVESFSFGSSLSIGCVVIESVFD